MVCDQGRYSQFGYDTSVDSHNFAATSVLYMLMILPRPQEMLLDNSATVFYKKIVI